jgi:hypothetical protein
MRSSLRLETSTNPLQALGIDLLWELPLALLSFGFYRANRLLISRLYRRYQSRLGSRATRWRLLNRSTLAMPISLPVLMTTGPRWNTHALIGTLGPLHVAESLSIRTSICVLSAASWTAVVYRFPDFLTVTQLSSLTTDPHADWSQVDLPAGRYILGIRYYGLAHQPQMPQVQVDGLLSTESADTPLSTNEVYADLDRRTNPYYHALHFYVFTVLRLRELLSPQRVRYEFLPVGDPDTDFRYGLVLARHRLVVQMNPSALAGRRIFFTAYNRASLPVLSEEITEPGWTSPSFSVDGFYLFRIRPLRPGLEPMAEGEFKLSLVPATSPSVC